MGYMIIDTNRHREFYADSRAKNILWARWIKTKLGPMIAISDETKLYLLEFLDKRNLENEIKNLRKKNKCLILPGQQPPLLAIEKELKAYFEAKAFEFHTPVKLLGTEFQLQVWDILIQIPLGQTISYRYLSQKLNRPKAFRAVAQANGANRLAIIVPCHRVINSDGNVGGYGGGIARKEWLIEHEKNVVKSVNKNR